MTAMIFALTFMPMRTANAAGAYSMTINNFDVEYVIGSDRTIAVEERVEISYEGTSNTGFYRDLPVNAGDRVFDVDVAELDGGSETAVEYSVELNDDLLSLNIGDDTLKSGEVHTYIIRYNFAVTTPTDPDALFLNVVGFGSEAPIEHSNITVRLPEGYESAKLYVGYNTRVPQKEFSAADGNVISFTLDDLKAFNGATLDMFFAEGALGTRFDIVPYIMVFVGCAVLAATFVVKFLVFPQRPLSPVVNFEPPRGYDPVVVGKLIDNKVEGGDVTSLIFYWASKGYLKIDLSNESDPLLIRVVQQLPSNAPEHQRAMYDALFSGGDMVKISAWAGKFYNVIENVKGKVNARHANLYTKKSLIASACFGIAGGLVMVLAPILTGMICIHPTLIYFPAMLAILPAFAIYMLALTVYYMKNRLNKNTLIAMCAGIALACAVFTAAYCILLPSAIMELAPKILACVAAYIIVAVSVTFITRTDEYTEQLNEIVGFKNFILYTEKDRLEAMLKDDPELYYKILPYAQVMGVSDIWEEKFKDLEITPPAWLSDPAGTIVSFAVINRAVRVSSDVMRSKLVSRPSSRSYSGGSRHGGGFGGRGGGGHGGGGFRGR